MWAGEVILSLDTKDFTPFALARLVQSRDAEMGQHMHLAWQFSHRSGVADQTGVPCGAVCGALE
jgi:hypothetical protein